MFKSSFGRASAVVFLTAFTLRLIPEILAGRWPLGFDTITYYVPTIMSWAGGDFSLATFNSYAPLSYFLLFFVYFASGSVFLALKILGPLLYGLLCSSFFFFVSKGLGWNKRKGLLAAFLFSFYFLTLRISWDYYRNMLGLAFFFLFLPFLRKFDELPRSRKFIASILAILVALSHELVSILMFIIIFSDFALIFKSKGLNKVFKESLYFMPSLIVFSFFAYGNAIMFHEVPGSINYLAHDTYFALLGDIFGVFSFIFGLLLPFIISGFWRDRTLDSWSLVCLLGSFWPLLFPWFQVISWDRWMFMLGPPFTLYIVNSFDRIKVLKGRSTSHGRFHTRFSKLALVLLIIIGSTGIVYAIFPVSITFSPSTRVDERLGHYIPGSMLCNTFPIDDCDDFEKCFQYVNKKLDNSSVLIIHKSLTGWARLYLGDGKNVINYNFNSPLDGVSEALSKGYETIYLIWWKNGYGWYAQKSLPSCFEPEGFVSSYVAVYTYK